MSEHLRSALATLPLLVAAASAALAAPRQGGGAPRVRPLAETTVGVKPWETVSTAPWGWSRMGGSDQRNVAFSPDGKTLATEDAGGWQLELWDIATGKSLGRFGRIHDPVSLAFAPDGKTLVSA